MLTVAVSFQQDWCQKTPFPHCGLQNDWGRGNGWLEEGRFLSFSFFIFLFILKIPSKMNGKPGLGSQCSWFCTIFSSCSQQAHNLLWAPFRESRSLRPGIQDSEWWSHRGNLFVTNKSEFIGWLGYISCFLRTHIVHKRSLRLPVYFVFSFFLGYSRVVILHLRYKTGIYWFILRLCLFLFFALWISGSSYIESYCS